jgi:hypothetical protein
VQRRLLRTGCTELRQCAWLAAARVSQSPLALVHIVSKLVPKVQKKWKIKNSMTLQKNRPEISQKKFYDYFSLMNTNVSASRIQTRQKLFLRWYSTIGYHRHRFNITVYWAWSFGVHMKLPIRLYSRLQLTLKSPSSWLKGNLIDYSQLGSFQRHTKTLSSACVQ